MSIFNFVKNYADLSNYMKRTQAQNYKFSWNYQPTSITQFDINQLSNPTYLTLLNDIINNNIKSISFERYKTLLRNWKWNSNSCWLDTFFINMIITDSSTFRNKICNTTVNHTHDELHNVLFLLSETVDNDPNNVEMEIDSNTRKHIIDLCKEIEPLTNINLNCDQYSDNRYGSVSAILRFMSYLYYFNYTYNILTKDGENYILKSYTQSQIPYLSIYTQDEITREIENKFVDLQSYLNEIKIENIETHNFLLIDISTLDSNSALKNTIPDFPLTIEIGTNKFKLGGASMFSSARYTSIISDNYFNYFYVNVLNGTHIQPYSDQRIETINNEKHESLSLKNNGTVLYYFRYN